MSDEIQPQDDIAGFDGAQQRPTATQVLVALLCRFGGLPYTFKRADIEAVEQRLAVFDEALGKFVLAEYTVTRPLFKDSNDPEQIADVLVAALVREHGPQPAFAAPLLDLASHFALVYETDDRTQELVARISPPVE